jgi:radical SAM superfamily enzyme YgiQ (UPF0313 family)
VKPLKKILLVRTNPIRPRTGTGPPLGCLHLAGAVRQWLDPKIEIRLTEMRASKMSFDDLSAVYRDFAPDVVGFSTLSCEHADLLEAARRCKTWNRDCFTVAGGPHASMFGDLLVTNPDIDMVVRGEGEHTFVELLRAWAEEKSFGDIPGLMFAENGDEIVETAPRPLETDLDLLPPPAWDLLDIPTYARSANMNGLLAASPYVSVMTTRGCPYRCKFCHRLFGTKIRKRSVEHVMDELETLYHRWGVREIHFVDDCFNLDIPRAMRIADEIVSRGLRFKIAFPNAIRGDRMPDELIAKLKAAGAYIITYAVETANPRLQKLINKNLNLDKVSQAIETSYKLGVIPAAFFMLGFPTETAEEMERTIRFACDSSILKAYFFTVVPFPRTELFEEVKRTYPDMELPEEISYSHSYWASDPYYTRATGIDIEAVQRDAYRRFYFDPLRIARILKLFPKNMDLVRGVFYGFQASFRLVERLNDLRLRLAFR